MVADPWVLASDIFTDYEGTISDAKFEFNEYGGQFRVTVDEIDGRENPTWENYNLPPGWESPDGGETIVRVAGDEKGITKSSQYGRFLAAVAGCGNARDELGDDAPLTASAWIGTRWRFEVTEAGKGKPYKVKDKDTGEMKEGVTKDKNYPVEYLGKDSTVTASTNGQSAGGSSPSLSVLTDLGNPVYESQIRDLAAQLPYPAWFSQSYKLIQENEAQGGKPMAELPDLISAMSQRQLYESLGGKG